MKKTLYLKVFLIFFFLSMLLLLLLFFSFNMFYKQSLLKKEEKLVSSIIVKQERIIKSFFSNSRKKLKLLRQDEILAQYLKANKKNQDLLEDLLTLFVSSDDTIYQAKILSLNGQELIRVDSKNFVAEVVPKSRLENRSIEFYYKELRRLKPNEIWQSYLEINKENGEIKKPIKHIVHMVQRTQNYFIVLVFDLKNIFESIQNSFGKKSYILCDDGFFILHADKKHNWSRYLAPNENIYKMYPDNASNILEFNYLHTSDFISKRIYLNYQDYIILLTKYKKDAVNSLEKYLIPLLILATIISMLLAFIFSKPILKLFETSEEKNKALDDGMKKNSIKLSESLDIIDKHVMSIRMNKQRIITEISSAMCEVTGFSKEELLGHNHKMLMHPDMSIDEYNFMWDKLESGEELTIEFKGIKKNGGHYWVESYIQPIFNNEAQIVGFTAIRNNITNRKTIQTLYSDINYQIGQYNAIFENANSGIGLIDLDGKFKKVNGVLSNFLGYSYSEFLNLSLYDIVPAESKYLLSKIITEAKEIGSITEIEKIFFNKHKENIHLELSLNLLPDKKHFVFVVNSLEDKRKLQALNLNLENRIKNEVEKSRQKDKIHQQEQIKNAKLTSIGSLAAGITHEINTPLTYIKGNFEMMEYDILDLPNDEIKQRMLEDSKKIKDGLTRIANIVESMREMSQSSKEIKESTNIYSTLITSLTMAYNRSKQISKVYVNGKIFTIDNINKDEYSFICKVQKQRLEQVWIIILNNALDELTKVYDYEKRRIDINIFEEKKEVIISFKDNAGGINPEILEDIFEPFVSSKEHSGMGVGLNIAKKIINEQNGVIKAFNENSCAVFEIRLIK